MKNRKTGHNWAKLYENYSKKWDEWNKKLPGGMADKKFGFRSFRNVYVSLENARKAEQAQGLRKKSLNVMRDIINEQKYPLTKAEASARTRAMRIAAIKKLDAKQMTKAEFNKAVKQINKQINFKGVRSGQIRTDEFWEGVTKSPPPARGRAPCIASS